MKKVLLTILALTFSMSAFALEAKKQLPKQEEIHKIKEEAKYQIEEIKNRAHAEIEKIKEEGQVIRK